MSSSVPYLVRAMYTWILDNKCTPYLIVDVAHPEANLPLEYARDGQIVLNISPIAVRDLRLENDHIEFGGRFAGVARLVSVPIAAVLGIIARENQEGMWFPRTQPPRQDPPKPTEPSTRGRPNLRLVE